MTVSTVKSVTNYVFSIFSFYLQTPKVETHRLLPHTIMHL